MADVVATEGRYVLTTGIMVSAPVEEVRALLADHDRLADWVPCSRAAPDGTRADEVRLDVRIRRYTPSPFVGRTEIEPEGAVVRRWAHDGPHDVGVPIEPRWHRTIRYTTTFVQGGTLVDVEVTTTVPGQKEWILRRGGKAEGKALERGLAAMARIAEGRRRSLRGAPWAAGPL